MLCLPEISNRARRRGLTPPASGIAGRCAEKKIGIDPASDATSVCDGGNGSRYILDADKKLSPFVDALRNVGRWRSLKIGHLVVV
ncbi:hypothetical protein IFM12276_40280 [Nocardia sputorum]|uniref:Uncharacterized protein n=1 Tax=Nocardia sputorum TaxID=2984338 RepID=A0ABN6U780_9NOCA|nr:hypothetical protein IFM12276_40280 [Nocardia sputorum]